ncbi:S1C family serine protease [Simkania sp.]|uniref:S1C family serine protease n=1 Tax=Simkania sp. TaxID=34094 RepID=UPI003B51D3FE
MKSFLLASLFFLFNSGLFASSPFVEVATLASSSTVLVHADEQKECGFIVREDGLVMTLYHNVKDAASIQVRLPNHTWVQAHLFFGDLESDVALLQLEASDLDYLPLTIAFQIGEWALSAGIPFRKNVTVKKGMVAAIEEKNGKNFLLVDFPFNPGDYGGPLLNLEGKVIGMQFANTTTHDVFGVIIPSETLLDVALKLGVFL